MNFNEVIVAGNLTRSPELEETPSGTKVTNVGIAVNRKYKDEQETSFFDVTLFGKSAKTLCEYAEKGSNILFQGRLKQDRWTDEQKGRQSKVKIIARRFVFGNNNRADKSEQNREDDSESVPF